MDIQKQNKRVLLIEDDQNFAALILRWLNSATAWDVVNATNGIEATNLITNDKWDLIISDINLPHVDGFELLKYCKRYVPRVPVLMITAHESVEFAIAALRNKADDLLIKPFDREAIIEKTVELFRSVVETKKVDSTRILAIGAHPDDVEIGGGGFLAKHAANQDDIAILTLSDGSIGGEMSKRIKESEAAAKLVGAQLFWGNLADTRIGSGRETIGVIERAITRFNPDIVLTHSKNDQHQDHRNTHLATVVASRNVPNLYCYQSPSSTIDFRPTYFANIDEQLEAKLELINQYESQVDKCSYLASDLISSTARYWGRYAGNGLVEPFEVMKERK